MLFLELIHHQEQYHNFYQVIQVSYNEKVIKSNLKCMIRQIKCHTGFILVDKPASSDAISLSISLEAIRCFLAVSISPAIDNKCIDEIGMKKAIKKTGEYTLSFSF